MSAPNCPCRDCPDRKLGCHGMCRRYQEWKKVNDAIVESRIAAGKTRPILSRAMEYLYRQNLKQRR